MKNFVKNVIYLSGNNNLVPQNNKKLYQNNDSLLSKNDLVSQKYRKYLKKIDPS